MKLTGYAPLLQKYQSRGLLVDTSLFLLFLAGRIEPVDLNAFRPVRNQGYTLKDLELLLAIMNSFPRLVTTPHVLTEISNHADTRLLRQAALVIPALQEEFVCSKELSKREGFTQFWLG